MGAPGRGKPTILSRLIGAASLLALLEFAATTVIGRFLEWGRAEPLLFFAFRPWMLLAAALIALRWRWPERAALYALALLLASASEAAFLLALGAVEPWTGAARGLLGGAGLALLLDLLLQLGSRFGRTGIGAAILVGLTLLLLPGASRPYEAVVLGPAPRPSVGTKPELMVMTGLPIIWGEGGAFDPNARPAASYRYLEQEFSVRPLDTLERAGLGQGRLLLLAQTRALAPRELVALDEWVGRGGRVLILADPTLIWPSELPLGDIRRPPALNLLDPLLTHWGLRLEPRTEAGIQVEPLYGEWSGRRLTLAAAGRFTATGGRCRAWLPATLAHCRIGEGGAWLIGDADLMHDALWLPPSAAGELRRRTADNPLLVADLLDRLAGLQRPRAAAPIQWIADGASETRALLAGLAPLLAAGLAGIAIGRVRRR
jgi:hypothetical protein